MVSGLNLTFKKVVLLSVFVVLLGVSLVYALSIGFKPGNSQRTGSTSTFKSGVPHPPLAVDYLLVFAYDGDNQSVGSSSFVQASVTITGREDHNGTTSTDPQNPLRFLLMPGEYSISATYNSATPQNETVRVGTSGNLSDVFFNFGSSPLPSLGHIAIEAWYISKQPSGEFLGYQVQASIAISGPEYHNGTTGTGSPGVLIFTVAPGEYSVYATYDSATPQSDTVSVAAGRCSGGDFCFGDASVPPP